MTLRKILPLFFLFFIASCSESTPQLSPLPLNAVIVAFGDSLTYGTGVTRQDSYPAVLETLIHRRVINAGVPGEQSIGGVARLPGVLANFHPQLVILCLGGNDSIKRLPADITEKNLQKMVDMIKQAHAEVVMLAVPALKLSAKPPAFYKTIAERNHIPLAENLIPSIMKDRSNKSDWVHFNKKGYKLLAEGVAQLLAQSGAIQK